MHRASGALARSCAHRNGFANPRHRTCDRTGSETTAECGFFSSFSGMRVSAPMRAASALTSVSTNHVAERQPLFQS